MEIPRKKLPLVGTPESDNGLPDLLIGDMQRFSNGVQAVTLLDRSIALRPPWGTCGLGKRFGGLSERCYLRDRGQLGHNVGPSRCGGRQSNVVVFHNGYLLGTY